MPDKLHRCVLVSSAWAFTLRLAPYATPVLLTEHGSDKTADRIVEALLQLCDKLKPLLYARKGEMGCFTPQQWRAVVAFWCELYRNALRKTRTQIVDTDSRDTQIKRRVQGGVKGG